MLNAPRLSESLLRPLSTPRFGASTRQQAPKSTATNTTPADTFQSVSSAVRFGGPRKPLVTGEEVETKLKNLAEIRTVAYRQKIQAVLDEAKAYIEDYLKQNPGAKGAIGMDLDETLLDNSAFETLKLFSPVSYYTFMRQAEAPAIPETLEFFRWLKEKNLNVFFISARPEFLKEATAENLRKVGITPDQYEGLHLKPKDFPKKESSAVFKSNVREEIQAQGYDFIAMLGDQQSDITGTLGRGFLLPNSLYFVH